MGCILCSHKNGFFSANNLKFIYIPATQQSFDILCPAVNNSSGGVNTYQRGALQKPFIILKNKSPFRASQQSLITSSAE